MCNKIFISLFIILQYFFLSNGDCGPWIPLDIDSLPPAQQEDIIDVQYLVAPLLECSYGDEASYIDAYHAGLSFRNRHSGYTITINFDASPSFQLAVIPHIVTYPNGTVDLIWENYGKVFIYAGQNDTYWETVYPIATMNGTSYNLFMKWLHSANDSYPYYNLWSVWTDWPGKVLLSNYECFAFVWTSLGTLKQAGGSYLPNVSPKQSFISLYSSSTPVKVNLTDPAAKAALVDFYQTLEAKINNLGIIGFLKGLWDIVVDGEFYVRKDNDYYYVILDNFPYFDIHYVEIPLP
jgi:hypothetical protein